MTLFAVFGLVLLIAVIGAIGLGIAVVSQMQGDDGAPRHKTDDAGQTLPHNKQEKDQNGDGV